MPCWRANSRTDGTGMPGRNTCRAMALLNACTTCSTSEGACARPRTGWKSITEGLPGRFLYS
ncbi:Uncharacterised protein [Bordetella pertussis]|nr:Uncharacterised protein [Bordetella pertussis]CFP65867.1 Uncharacterised protein [Bordetella pertussis]